MSIWTYRLRNGGTGTVRAASDDDAWNEVLAQAGQAPEVLQLVCDNSSGGAA
jgi:hypothetical protein